MFKLLILFSFPYHSRVINKLLLVQLINWSIIELCWHMFLSCLTGISIDDLYLAPEHSNNFASEKVWNVRTMKRQNHEKTRQLHGLLSLKRCFTQKPSRFLRKDQTHCSQYRDLFVFDRSIPQHLFWSFKTKL